MEFPVQSRTEVDGRARARRWVDRLVPDRSPVFDGEEDAGGPERVG